MSKILLVLKAKGTNGLEFNEEHGLVTDHNIHEVLKAICTGIVKSEAVGFAARLAQGKPTSLRTKAIGKNNPFVPEDGDVRAVITETYMVSVQMYCGGEWTVELFQSMVDYVTDVDCVRYVDSYGQAEFIPVAEANLRLLELGLKAEIRAQSACCIQAVGTIDKALCITKALMELKAIKPVMGLSSISDVHNQLLKSKGRYRKMFQDSASMA